jgi:predicted DNA binding protein
VTVDLGVLLGISDQVVSERIRRGVETLARNALDVPDRQREDAY